jgi:hypothetical protein
VRRYFNSGIILLALAALAFGGEKWTRFRSGPFEVLTNGGQKNARAHLLEAEEFRYTLGKLIGKDDPQSIFPIRMVILKNPKQAADYAVPGEVAIGRDAWMSAPDPETPLDSGWKRKCARILIDDNTPRIPDEIEDGLIAVLSTLESKGPQVTLGAPPPAPERTRAWARMELLATTADYADRMQIFISNLEQGADYDAAYQNAFELKAADVEKKVDAFEATGVFEAVPFSGRAMSAADFTAREATGEDGQLALADLLFSNPARAEQAEAAYRALGGPGSQEGLGFLAERAKRPEAKSDFEAATQAGSQNARAWMALGTTAAFKKAAALNPRWAEPYFRFAAVERDPARKVLELKKATELDPRNTDYWQALAIAATDAQQYDVADKAWAGAERAAGSPAERQKMRQARLDNEAKRAAFAEAERKRKEEEAARELQRVKDASLAAIQAEQDKVNRQLAQRGPVPQNPVPWQDTTPANTHKVTGMLQRIECLPRDRARMTIVTADGKTVRVMVAGVSRLSIGGVTLGCGEQHPARSVTVEYTPSKNKKSMTVGQAQAIEIN